MSEGLWFHSAVIYSHTHDKVRQVPTGADCRLLSSCTSITIHPTLARANRQDSEPEEVL